MTNHTYRVIEIVGTLPDSIDPAIRSGLARAAETTRGLDWFEVQSVRVISEWGLLRTSDTAPSSRRPPIENN
jgi:flavin-binding protein dodecin